MEKFLDPQINANKYIYTSFAAFAFFSAKEYLKENTGHEQRKIRENVLVGSKIRFRIYLR